MVMQPVVLKRIVLSFILPILAIAAYAQPPKYLEITFLTTNDIHSRLLPWDIPDDPEIARMLDEIRSTKSEIVFPPGRDPVRGRDVLRISDLSLRRRCKPLYYIVEVVNDV